MSATPAWFRGSLRLLVASALLLSSGGAGARVDHSWFVIARSKNRNVVRYDARLDRQSRLDTDNPVDAYWLMLAEDGRREELTWLERKLAYGYRVTRDRAGLVLTLDVSPERPIRLAFRGGRAAAFARIRGRTAQLERIFVRTREGGLVPSVLSVDLEGRDPTSGERVRERLQPD